MKNIFITFTPYHIFLSCSIALYQESSAENHLIIIRDFSGFERLLDSLRGWERSPFAQIESLPGIYGRSGKFNKQFTIRNNVTMIARYVSHHTFERVYIFNDAKPEAQCALYFAKKVNKRTVGVYVEDGAGAYSSYRLEKQSLTDVLLRKLFYGPWWVDVNILGTSRWIDEIKVIFPQIVRPELRLKPVTSIPKHGLLELRNQEWPYEYLKTLGVEITKLHNLDAILVVAHTEFANKIIGYKEVINDILHMAKSQNLRLGVKYHPRDPQDDFLSVRNDEGISVLPKSLPMELVYILASEKIKFIIGDISTSLLTAKWLLENVMVVSIAPLIGQIDSQLLRTFDKLNIKIVNDKMEAKGMFQK